MGPSGHFTSMWTRCGHYKLFGTGCHVIGTGFVFWVELPVQRRLCPIFMSGVGLPDIHEYSVG